MQAVFFPMTVRPVMPAPLPAHTTGAAPAVRTAGRPLKSLTLAVLCGLMALGLSGCQVTPVASTSDEVATRVSQDRSRMYAEQEPVDAPLTFHEAAARALKYNLDYRLKLMEGALASGLLDVSRYDMLPRLVANAGYDWRNNYNASRSDRVYPPPLVESLPYSTSVDTERATAGLGFSWNVLDFGVSYYRARQQADQVLIADERRRKVVQNILQDTRNAYWRALGAQRLMARMDELMARSQSAMQRARQIEQQGIVPQPQALAYQRALLDATTLIQVRRQDLELARAELAALMNLAPGTRFTLADESEQALPPMPANIQELEEMALVNRPELREEDYRKRITANDIRRAIVSTLPGLQFDFGGRYDGNSYLYNNDWLEGGVRLSMNLFRLASLPALNRANKAQAQVDDTRRLALSMAVLTQTRVAAQRYGLALSELAQAEEGARVDQRLLNYARSAQSSKVESELEVIRNEARSLLSQYQRHVAYSNAQGAWGRLYNSVGLDVLPAAIESSDVKTLAGALKTTMADWEKQTFKFQTPRTSQLPPLQLQVQVDDGQMREPARQAMGQALARAGVALVPASATAAADAQAWKLDARLEQAAPENGTRRLHWHLSLRRPDGSVAGERRYTSVLAATPSPSAFAALSQSAIDAHALDLAAWMREGPLQTAASETPEASR